MILQQQICTISVFIAMNDNGFQDKNKIKFQTVSNQAEKNSAAHCAEHRATL